MTKDNFIRMDEPRTTPLKKQPPHQGWLTGRLLVATPGMPDPRFERTVIFICSHTPSGTMGLIVNRPFNEADFPMLLDQLNIKSSASTPDVPVQFGGPVEMGRGFVLHSSEYLRDGTIRIDKSFAMTATVEILEDIAYGKGPARSLMALGYAGWGEGQLENELKNNGWLIVDTDPSLVFHDDLESKWNRALAKIGVNPATLSNIQGNA